MVIPVHNEAELLPCLAAIRAAADAAGVDVHVVVVLDGCTDGSESLVMATRPLGQTTDIIRIDETNVGAARTAGCELLIERYGVLGWWLATTDADSAVGPLWLRTHVRYARTGFDVVAGTITVDDWAIYGDEAERAQSSRRVGWAPGGMSRYLTALPAAQL